MDTREIVRVVRKTASALVGFEWQPFDQTAVLRLREHAGGSLVVQLEGLHLVATRQSLLGEWGHMPLGDEHWEDWPIDYFDLSDSGEFLERFLSRNLGFASHVVLYSGNGAEQDEPGFVRPVHLTLASGGNHLDVVCESVRLNPSRSGEPGAAADGGGTTAFPDE